MLVLTRRVGEEIVIDGNIRVTVVAIQKGRVRLGFTAPPSVNVVRQEIAEEAASRLNPVVRRPAPLASGRR